MSLFSILASVMAFGLVTDAPASSQEIRSSVQRSLPYIENRGDWWIKAKKCASCHRVSTMVWSLQEARRHGFEVGDRIDEWTDWAISESLSENDEGKIKARGNREGVAQLLVALQQLEKPAEQRQQLAALMIDEQQENGSWKPCGQLPSQKRPKPETAAVSAMWIVMAASAETSSDEAKTSLSRAREFLSNEMAAKSTEWYTSRLMLAKRDGDVNLQRRLIEQLRSFQRDDGGWGWLTADDSDALATGMALYALRQADVAIGDDNVQQAIRFLLQTQKEDGSWDVRGTKSNRKDKVQETASYWGTTWAVLGLLSALPNVASS